MGFFGNLFQKKQCDICGGDIGLLGNRKLEDGNMCKNCASKLSPWFDDRRHSTLADIRKQLEYREDNARLLSGFRPNRTFGEDGQIYIDESTRRFVVSEHGDYMSENADLIDFSSVTSVNMDIKSSHKELKMDRRGKDGKLEKVSYNPPKYLYSYNFYLVIRVNHDYFDEVKIKLNHNALEIEETGRSSFMNSNPGTRSMVYQNYEQLGRDIQNILMNSSAPSNMNTANMYDSSNVNMSNNASATNMNQASTGTGSVTKITCPYCNAVTNAARFCDQCGAPLS